MKVKHFVLILAGIVIIGLVIVCWLYFRQQEDLWKNANIVDNFGRQVIYGPLKEPFNHPTGITVGEDYIYVADSDNHKIRVFNRAWEQVSEFGGFGTKPGQLGYPISVGVTDKQEILVSEVFNTRVQVFSQQGKALRMFPAKTGIIPGPSAMTCGDGKLIYIFDRGAQEILVFDSQGNFLKHIGSDKKTGGIRYVMGMDVTKDGKLLVADSGNRGVRIYSPRGELLDRLFSGYSGVPVLSLPRGIAAIDKEKFALVDALSRKVYIMEKRNRKWESKMLKYDFVMPDSADYRDGKLYVTDRGDNCIVVFSL